ncbi:MAG: hypothetical protein II984_00665 [Clostridia bacterium]|nr:hypothetical protein [Clostridia bacterium]
MKEIIQHEKYGVIEFSEGSFLGNRSISINGQQLTKQSNKLFYIADGTAVRVVGGGFSAIKLDINGDIIQITKAPKWYEIAIYILGLVVFVVWSSSVTLCSIVPMIGGFIGAFLYAIPAVLGFRFSSQQNNPVLKLTITLCSVLLGLILCIIAGFIFVAALI